MATPNFLKATPHTHRKTDYSSDEGEENSGDEEMEDATEIASKKRQSGRLRSQAKKLETVSDQERVETSKKAKSAEKNSSRTDKKVEAEKRKKEKERQDQEEAAKLKKEEAAKKKREAAAATKKKKQEEKEAKEKAAEEALQARIAKIDQIIQVVSCFGFNYIEIQYGVCCGII